MKLNIDQAKHHRIVRETLFSLQGAHPAEIVLALGECIGRVIAHMDAHDIAKREMVDIAIKQMAAAIEHADKRIITQ